MSMPTVTEAIGGVVGEALGLTVPGLALVALAGAALVGAPRARGLTKNAIKGYLALRDRADGWLAETRETIQDLYAEAHEDYNVHLAGPAGATVAAARAPGARGAG